MTDSKSRCVVKISTDTRPIVYLTIDRLSTAMSTDISVDITHSKQDPVFSLPIQFPVTVADNKPQSVTFTLCFIPRGGRFFENFG